MCCPRVYYISPFSYTTQALLKLSFGGLEMLGFDECVQKARYPCYGDTGNDVLEAISTKGMNYNDVNPWTWFVVLISMSVAYRLLFYMFVRRTVY